MYIKIKYIFCFFLGSILNLNLVLAQDIQFSQFYSNVLFLNPAFTGSAQASRLVGHQRIQWPGLNAKYTTSFVSFDHYIPVINSGVGVYFMNDVQGNNILSSNNIAVLYAYQLPISENYSIRFGAKCDFVSRSINYGLLTFPDQYTNNGYQGPTNQPIDETRIRYTDLSAGLLFYGNHLWTGIALDHINNPDQSFYKNGTSNLPFKLDLTAGYRFDVIKPLEDMPEEEEDNRELFITPTIHYKTQGKSDQLDLGIYALYENRYILGLWYRGLPYIINYKSNIVNNESMVFQLGYKLKRWAFSYSYDQTVSTLYQTGTYGSHEINITHVFSLYSKKLRRGQKRLPCPDFR